MLRLADRLQYQALCTLKAEAARHAGIDPDRISFTVTVRIARDQAAAVRPPGQGQERHDAILDILAGLLPRRRDRQCERVKKPPRNTFPARKTRRNATRQQSQLHDQDLEKSISASR